MIGLIKYDLIQILSGIKGVFWLVYLIFISVLNVVGDMGNTFSYMLIIVSVMFGVAAFNYDEAYHWDRYTAALPVSTRQIVMARYGTVGACLLIGVISSAIFIGISYLAGNMLMEKMELLLSVLAMLIVSVLYIELMVPIMYRFGAERGRIAVLILFIAFFAMMPMIFSIAENTPLDGLAQFQFSLRDILIGAAAVVIILLPVSMTASIRIRAKKEF